MAPRSRAKLTNFDAGGGRRGETVAQSAYVAEIVSPREVCHLMRGVGGGVHGVGGDVARVGGGLARVGRGADGVGGDPDRASGRAIAWVAGRQLGLIATWQLQAIGIGHSAIAHRVRRGLLHRLHRGVFLVGHAVQVPGARELAALLACGEGAFVSHRSAALLWGLTHMPPAEVEVSVVARNCKSRGGLLIHRLARLDTRDRAVKNGIPTTSPARTLVDFAASATWEELEWGIAEARARRLVTDRQLWGALDRAGKRAGVGTLRASLRHQGGPRLTRSEAERRLLALIRAAKIPEPQANARVAGFEVDFFWPESRVIVEVDGFAYHGHRRAFERDRRRDMLLRDAGYEVIRVTWRQIVDEPLLVIAHIARALARAGSGYSSSASSP